MKPSQIRNYLGSRRSTMLTIAFFGAFLGITLYHDAGLEARGQSILFLDLPLWARLAGWVGTSIVASICAVWAPPRLEVAGWVALAAMPCERVISYAVSFTVWVLPGGREGTPWAAAYALQWATSIVLLRIVSSWQEDSLQRLRMTRRDEPPPAGPTDG